MSPTVGRLFLLTIADFLLMVGIFCYSAYFGQYLSRLRCISFRVKREDCSPRSTHGAALVSLGKIA
ncbi:hypothetical protein LCM4577_14395 [Mesorhizobium sp. LCM 4577]|nr:hypothetical protein LCM4577_14395 [Mesorhizobium sp. LCM 4577]